MKLILLFLIFIVFRMGETQFEGFGDLVPPVTAPPVTAPPAPTGTPGTGAPGTGAPGAGAPGFGGLGDLLPVTGLPSLPGLNGTGGLLPGVDVCALLKLDPSGLSEGVVGGVCKMAQGWIKGLPSGEPLQYRSILSPNQQKYWDSLVNCKDIQCLCDYYPECKEFGANIDVNHGGGGNASNATAAPGAALNITTFLKYIRKYGRSYRKEIRAMTDEERSRFFSALNKILTDDIDGWTKFEILTTYHFYVPFAPHGHFVAGLLPFHRELMRIMELALRFEDPEASWPYWDSSLDSELPNPKDTVLFTSELLGAGEGNVTDGPFANMSRSENSNVSFPVPLPKGILSRGFGLNPQGGVLFNKEYLKIIWAKPLINNFVFCYDPFFDAVHAAVHLYIMGLMTDPTTSPGDPIFYLHHVFIDYIWEHWREKHQDRKQREEDVAIPCPYGPWDLPMLQLRPFNRTVKDGYSNKYTDEFYEYQRQPSCANFCHNSKYLVCNKQKDRCMSKVKLGGVCLGGEDLDLCYNGKCAGGICVPA